MGNSGSSSSDPRLASATRAFTQTELDDLRSLYASLAAKSQSNGNHISPDVFKGYIGIDGPLGDRVFDLVSQKRRDQRLTFEDLVIAKVNLRPVPYGGRDSNPVLVRCNSFPIISFGCNGPCESTRILRTTHISALLIGHSIIAPEMFRKVRNDMATYEKGTNEDMEEFIYKLLNVSGDGTVGRSDLEVVLTSMFDNLFRSQSSEPKAGSYKEIVEVFINAANSTSDGMSFQDFQKWCSLLPAVRKYLGSLLMPSDSGSHVPKLVYPDNIDDSQILLRKEYAWHIGGALSPTELDEWKLLYHSSIHGLSFNTFLGNMLNDGPTVLIIKDREGDIYGGYASQPWEKHPDFYGDMRSFLFQLYPEASIFRPTGANHNLQWCAVNFTSESIPNGIGFGGRVSHFGLFVSANFDQGHSFTCTTFASPCLSKSSQIYPEVIECWGVAPAKADQDRTHANKGTVLDRFKEDRNMLNLVGLANSSE